MRDSMRQRSYDWENDLVKPRDNARLTDDQVRVFMDVVWDNAVDRIMCNAKSPFPAVKPALELPSGNSRFAWGGWQCVSLPQWARTRPVIAHEVAHALAQWIEIFGLHKYLGIPEDPGHGPTWFSIYASTLIEHKTLPGDVFKRSSKLYRLPHYLDREDVTTALGLRTR